jgi:hypothetical protein
MDCAIWTEWRRFAHHDANGWLNDSLSTPLVRNVEYRSARAQQAQTRQEGSEGLTNPPKQRTPCRLFRPPHSPEYTTVSGILIVLWRH